MNALPRDYDAWRLSNPADESNEIGVEDGQPCNRYPEPEEDAPRNWRPRPCGGLMVRRQEGAEHYETSWVECDRCGEVA